MSQMNSTPRDVGHIEGHELPDTAVPVALEPIDAEPVDVEPSPPAHEPPVPPSSGPVPPPPPYSPGVAGAGAGAAGPTSGSSESLPLLRQQSESAWARALSDIRHSRGRNVANSRPLPEWVQRFAWVLDSAVRVPGTSDRRVGVDGLIAVVPVAGDAIGIGLSLAVVLAGVAAGVSIPTILRMLLNVGVEALVGLVPFGGAIFDMVFKANMRNVVLMERDLADRRATRRSSIAVLVLSLLVVFVGLLMIVAMWVLTIALGIWLITRLF
jgi:hypothetical protein